MQTRCQAWLVIHRSAVARGCIRGPGGGGGEEGQGIRDGCVWGAWQVCSRTCQNFGNHAFPADAIGCHSRRAVGTANCPHASLLPLSGPQPAKSQPVGYAMDTTVSSAAAALTMLA